MITYVPEMSHFKVRGNEFRVYSELGELVRHVAETAGGPEPRDPIPRLESGEQNHYIVIEEAETGGSDWEVVARIREELLNGNEPSYFLEELLRKPEMEGLLERGQEVRERMNSASQYPFKFNI